MRVGLLIKRGQRKAESLMVDAGTLQRPNGTRVTDPDTFKVVDGLDPVYTGKAKLQTTVGQVAEPEAGSVRVIIGSAILHLPASAPLAQVDDVWRFTDSVNPHLVGQVFRVVDPDPKTFGTAQRIKVEQQL